MRKHFYDEIFSAENVDSIICVMGYCNQKRKFFPRDQMRRGVHQSLSKMLQFGAIFVQKAYIFANFCKFFTIFCIFFVPLAHLMRNLILPVLPILPKMVSFIRLWHTVFY
jgi:hypothetical protein